MKAELKNAAQREGISLTQFLLTGAYERLRRRPVLKPEEYEGLVELHEQLRRAGINLNSLLRKEILSEMSNRRRPLKADFEALHEELDDAMQKISVFVNGFQNWRV